MILAYSMPKTAAFRRIKDIYPFHLAFRSILFYREGKIGDLYFQDGPYPKVLEMKNQSICLRMEK